MDEAQRGKGKEGEVVEEEEDWVVVPPPPQQQQQQQQLGTQLQPELPAAAAETNTTGTDAVGAGFSGDTKRRALRGMLQRLHALGWERVDVWISLLLVGNKRRDDPRVHDLAIMNAPISARGSDVCDHFIRHVLLLAARRC
jgi:hypothetical protein